MSANPSSAEFAADVADAGVAATSSFWKRRGMDGHVQRLRELDVESREDFLSGFRAVIDPQLWKVTSGRAMRLLEQQHIDPHADTPMDTLVKLFLPDPLIGTSIRVWVDVQDLIWSVVAEEFERHSGRYLAEMASFERVGPGSLELDANLHIPDYCKHEIHRQPGGFVGNPFGGYIHYYGTRSFYKGRNDRGQVHAEYASAVPKPPDGSVLRILEMGCSEGQFTMALKQRFPEAEVWGIDVGAPMVRFAHMRAVDLGVDVHFAQRLAEDTRFPDNHFDIVTSYILHHEVDAEASIRIIREAFRVLRGGGVFFPIDAYTGNKPESDAYIRFRVWWDHVFNNERWRVEYAAVPFAEEMRRAGFEVNENGPAAWWTGSDRNLVGIKPR